MLVKTQLKWLPRFPFEQRQVNPGAKPVSFHVSCTAIFWNVKPAAVVLVGHTSTPRFSYRGNQAVFMVGPDGYVLTAWHSAKETPFPSSICFKIWPWMLLREKTLASHTQVSGRVARGFLLINRATECRFVPVYFACEYPYGAMYDHIKTISNLKKTQ